MAVTILYDVVVAQLVESKAEDPSGFLDIVMEALIVALTRQHVLDKGIDISDPSFRSSVVHPELVKGRNNRLGSLVARLLRQADKARRWIDGSLQGRR